MITLAQLSKMMPHASLGRLQIKLEPVNLAMVAFGIDQTPQRIASYLAQVAHETGEFRYAREIASGVAYEGRVDLGNIHPGDGVKYPGRGDLQITGAKNYEACSLALYGDYRLLEAPELLEAPWDGSQAGGWFWQSHGLNPLADAGDFERISAIINGRNRETGMPNGWESRVAYFQTGKVVFA